MLVRAEHAALRGCAVRSSHDLHAQSTAIAFDSPARQDEFLAA
jgi:hypothetical protein